MSKVWIGHVVHGPSMIYKMKSLETYETDMLENLKTSLKQDWKVKMLLDTTRYNFINDGNWFHGSTLLKKLCLAGENISISIKNFNIWIYVPHIIKLKREKMLKWAQLN